MSVHDVRVKVCVQADNEPSIEQKQRGQVVSPSCTAANVNLTLYVNVCGVVKPKKSYVFWND